MESILDAGACLARMHGAPLSRMLRQACHERSLAHSPRRGRRAAGCGACRRACRKIGVLLVNLGTPDATDAASVRRYLKEFLSDPRVIEDQGPLWRLVLNGIILPVRPRRKARDYRQDLEPRARTNRRSRPSRARRPRSSPARSSRSGRHIMVDWAMRYGNPSIASRLDALVAQGCERILVVPLYPQYAAATTATVCDEASAR